MLGLWISLQSRRSLLLHEGSVEEWALRFGPNQVATPGTFTCGGRGQYGADGMVASVRTGVQRFV